MNKLFEKVVEDFTDSKGVGKFPIHIGYTETGTEVKLDLLRLKHVLISGMSQSGKSTMVRNLLPSLVKYADVAIYTTKDSDFIDFKGKACICSDLDMMSALVRQLVGEIERRNDDLRKAREKDGIKVKCEDRPMIALIDEFQSFQEMADTATMYALKRVIREGAGLNVFVYIITQSPTKKVLSDGLRDNIMTDIAFKQRDAYIARMAVGDRTPQFLELHQCIVRNVDKMFKVTKLA